MIYELRVYTTIPGRLPNLLARFENHTLRIWEKHGIRQLGFWYVFRLFSDLIVRLWLWSPINPIVLVYLTIVKLILVDRTTLVGPDANDLTYMLAWESLAEREQKWDAFFNDPEWIEARANSEKDGAINAKVASSFLVPTKFSAIQ
ncbi:hypothetical protein AYO20_03678 [Fonsecaea nubica]|uniref:NIPSNAP domain-containing protein n=1 Tax=Fonsecaea nubica TaxID=856822 RepID=A0A178D4A5_9EURO|nr:hypothetical protein AYO20_03678 [Fonsecaea nubica]OAL36909.1 hypothetical protein AYO20_03678 [Fonsecaea nubica]